MHLAIPALPAMHEMRAAVRDGLRLCQRATGCGELATGPAVQASRAPTASDRGGQVRRRHAREDPRQRSERHHPLTLGLRDASIQSPRTFHAGAGDTAVGWAGATTTTDENQHGP